VSKASKLRKRQEREREERNLARKNKDQEADKAPEDSAAKGAANESKDEFNSAKSYIVITLEFLGTGVFGWLSRMAFSTDHKISGIWLGLISFGCASAIFATNTAGRFPPKLVWRVYALLLALCAVCCGFWTFAITNSPTTQAAVPEYIRGTKTTLNQMERWFPFGWYIFYPENHGSLHSDPGPRNKVMMDWKAVEIISDFSSNKVQFWFTDPVWWKVENGTNRSMFHLEQMSIGKLVDIKREIFYVFDAIKSESPNDPVPWLGTLNDDQRAPVYAIGFRIHYHKSN
jgi:hypothetical protein